MCLRKAFFIEKGVNIPFDRSLFLVEKEVKEIKKSRQNAKKIVVLKSIPSAAVACNTKTREY
jgi:hypothetical protein